MSTKYARSLQAGQHSGFPDATGWDTMAETLAASGQFCWFREIMAELGNGKVRVKDFGDMLMLGGYSYLGLNQHPAIRAAAIQALDTFGSGTSGSRWLAGHTCLHEELETLIAQIHGTEDAIAFSSGYVTNISTLAALLNRDDLVLSDRLNHASLLDGCRFSGAKLERFRHNNPEHLHQKLKQYRHQAKRCLVVVDAVFSMSGQVADIPSILAVCREFDAALMVDECHSNFVLGQQGGGIKEYFGLTANDITLTMGSLSKAIPASGGYIAASADLCNFLRREARGFIYSGSPSAVMVAVAIAALQVFLSERTVLLAQLARNTAYLRQELRQLQIPVSDAPTPITPILIGPAAVAAAVATACHQDGILIHPVLPPVVPQHQSILRASTMANHQEADLQAAASIIVNHLHQALANWVPAVV